MNYILSNARTSLTSRERQSMLEENKTIIMQSRQVARALRAIVYIQTSLKNIDAYYQSPKFSNNENAGIEYAIEKNRFIDDNRITRKLAKVRRILSGPFNKKLGEDEMDDFERRLEGIVFWRKPGD